MALKPKFTELDVKRRMERVLSVIRKQQIEMMQELGEMCVTIARELPADVGFKDQTGNLRSSIGYMVFVDGVAVRDNYVQVAPKKEVEGVVFDGVERGKKLAEKVGTARKNGVCLVVTAGMNYAEALETGRRKTRGGVYYQATPRDVLTSAELHARKEFPALSAEIVQNLKIVTSE